MTGSSRGPLHRVAAATILGSLLMIALATIVHPLRRALVERSDSIERSLRLLEGYRRAAAARPALEKERDALLAKEAILRGLVEGPASALAAANVQSDVKRIIESNGGEIRSVQTMPSSTVDDFEKIELRYDLSVVSTKLVDVLYQIESHLPYLFLDEVEIHGLEGSVAAVPGQPVAKLSVRWTIHAYRWAGKR